MSKKSNLSIASDAWRFGNYLDARGQTAHLVIHYPIRGTPATKPLVLPLTKAKEPKSVMQALVDAGADIDPDLDIGALKARLERKELEEGNYLQKLGQVDEIFIMPVTIYGKTDQRVITNPDIQERAQRYFQAQGSLDEWKSAVAIPASKSSFCMFAIAQSFAAPLLSRVFDAGDEGFLVNLAGGSSRGKTTALMAGRSVAGRGDVLSSWEQTTRSLCEDAAATSDNLMAIDDLDKVFRGKKFAQEFATVTHMLTSGASRQYAAVVKGNLPDLYWSFCGMTGARATVEELSVGHGHQREDHERVRCLDLRVPEPENGGIWDDIDKGDIPSDLTDRMKVATARHYGSALPVWLNHIVGNEKVVEDARALIDFYLDEVGLDVADNIGHRVGKKFGIVYAAAILAEEAGILPWDRDAILAVVRDLHENALTTLFSEADQIRRGLANLLNDVRKGTWLQRPKGETPVFSSNREAKAFVRGETTLLIDQQVFDRAFLNDAVAQIARKRLADAGAIQAPAKGAMTKQVRVLIKGQEVKRRYLVIDLERLDVAETSLKAVPR